MAKFKGRIKYNKRNANGIIKTITEQYLLPNVLSFTEAEAKLTEAISPFLEGDFAITALQLANIDDIVYSDNDTGIWFKAKINIIIVDEKSNSERKKPHYILVNAHHFQQTKDRLMQYMKGTIADFEIAKVEETNIIDVIK